MPRLGFGLADIKAMAISPRVQLSAVVGRDPVLPLAGSGWFVTNSRYSPRWRRDAPKPDREAAWASWCDSLTRLGRVMGYTRDLGEVSGDPWGDDAEPAPSGWMKVTVHLFQTTAGARKFTEWATSQWSQSYPTAQQQDLPGGGTGDVLMHRTRHGATFDVALVRHGQVVGEVESSKPKGWAEAIDTNAVALRLGRRIASTKPTGNPFDVTAVMSAPLTLAQWESAEPAAVHYPQLAPMGVDLVGDEDFGSPTEVRHAKRFALVARYSSDVVNDASQDDTWLDPSDRYDISALPYPEAGTSLSLYRDAATARAALADLTAQAMRDPGAKQFHVAGIDGAVGIRTRTLDWVSDEFVGYSWRIYFTRGPALAQAYVENNSLAKSAWDQDRVWALDATNAWVARLRHVIGPN